MNGKEPLVTTGNFLCPKNPHDGLSGNTKRPLPEATRASVGVIVLMEGA